MTEETNITAASIAQVSPQADKSPLILITSNGDNCALPEPCMVATASTGPVRIMLDIETLGINPGSVITSIGAVAFDQSGVTHSFYQRICPSSCTDVGLVIDPDTVLWWMKQSDEARKELTLPASPLADVLLAFSEWTAKIDPSKKFEVWGNGATFDNILLSFAYRAASLPIPWGKLADRCYRTIKNLRPDIKIQRAGTHHNALDDATSQALHLIQIEAAIKQ